MSVEGRLVLRPIAILCADSDRQLGRFVRYGLGGYGYQVMTTTKTQELYTLVAQKAPDFILMDTDLEASLKGLAICQRLREWYTAPIIFLSNRQDRGTTIAALNAGADDYVIKPFYIDELEARIRAVLRRSAIKEARTPAAELRVEDFVLNLVQRRVFLDGKEVHFTPTEYRILHALVIHAGKILSYGDLVVGVWGRRQTRTEHNLRVYVNLIRKKLGEEADHPRFIFTENGVGYRFIDIPAPSQS